MASETRPASGDVETPAPRPAPDRTRFDELLRAVEKQPHKYDFFAL